MEHVDTAALVAEAHRSGWLASMQADFNKDTATLYGMRVHCTHAHAAFTPLIARTVPPCMPPNDLASFSAGARSSRFG